MQRGPQGALKLKIEVLQSSSSESSDASENKSEPSPLEAPELAPAASSVQKLAPSGSAEISIIDLASPEDEDVQPLHQNFCSPPLSIGNKVVRTNWANFPVKSGRQSVLLTRFQVSSGSVSVPLGRAHSVLGAFTKSCTVTLQSPSSTAFGPFQETWQCGYKLYQSQPTQVFLTKLKAIFTAFAARAGDVLSLSEVSPGICNAQIWHATSAQAIEFKALLANGWSDVSPPLKNPVSPPGEYTTDTAAEERKRRQRAKDVKRNDEILDDLNGEEEGKEEEEGKRRESRPVVEQTTSRRTRQAPRRFIVYSSSESQEEEEVYNKDYSVEIKRKLRGRPRKIPAAKEQQQQQQPGGVFVSNAKNTMDQNNNSRIYSRLQDQRQIHITNYTLVNPPPGQTPSRRRPAGDRLRRSPAKKPRKAYQPTPIDLTEDPEALIINNGTASVLNETAATRRNRRSAARRSFSPPEATTKQRKCSTYKTAGSVSSGSDGKTPGSSGGRVRKPGGGYSTRSEAAYLKMRRMQRKGIPLRAPDGEPTMQAYYDALAFVDSFGFRKSCIAA